MLETATDSTFASRCDLEPLAVTTRYGRSFHPRSTFVAYECIDQHTHSIIRRQTTPHCKPQMPNDMREKDSSRATFGAQTHACMPAAPKNRNPTERRPWLTRICGDRHNVIVRFLMPMNKMSPRNAWCFPISGRFYFRSSRDFMVDR